MKAKMIIESVAAFTALFAVGCGDASKFMGDVPGLRSSVNSESRPSGESVQEEQHDQASVPVGKSEGRRSGSQAGTGEADVGSNLYLEECARASGLPVAAFKEMGTQTASEMGASTGLFMFLRGRSPQVQIEISDKDASELGAICIIAVGNDAAATVASNIKVGTLVVFAAGNSASVDFTVNENGVLGKSSIKAAGIGAEVSIHGPGSLGCASVTTSASGNSPSIKCGTTL